jgi:hypothetical protein
MCRGHCPVDVSRCEQTDWDWGCYLLLVPRLFQRDEFCDSHRSQEVEHVLDNCRYPADFVASGFQFSHSRGSGPPLADWCSGGSGCQPAKPAPNSVKSAFAGGDELSWILAFGL